MGAAAPTTAAVWPLGSLALSAVGKAPESLWQVSCARSQAPGPWQARPLHSPIWPGCPHSRPDQQPPRPARQPGPPDLSPPAPPSPLRAQPTGPVLSPSRGSAPCSSGQTAQMPPPLGTLSALSLSGGPHSTGHTQSLHQTSAATGAWSRGGQCARSLRPRDPAQACLPRGGQASTSGLLLPT